METHIQPLWIRLLLWASYCGSVSSIFIEPEAPGCPNPGSDGPASPVLESLECRNDYTTHIRCSWTETSGSPLSLVHLDPDYNSVLPCVRRPLLAQNTPAQSLRVQCRYNTSLFAIGFDDVFFFNTSHSPGITKSVNLTQHAGRRHPIDLDVNIIDHGEQKRTPVPPETSSTNIASQHLTSAWPSNLHLSSQPSSGRPGREGTHIEMEGSEPGETGKKRRSKETSRRWEDGLGREAEYDGSGWSPLSLGKSDTDSLSGPFNLQCEYDGDGKVKCSWEMMRELSQFVLYSLSYRTRPDAPSGLCCGRLEEGGGGADEAVVKFSCSFFVFKAEVLQLHLRPEPRTRDFQSYKHIEPAAPEGLSVELIRDDWVLNWTIPKYRTVLISTELRYWSSHSPEDVETVRLPPRVSDFNMAERSLLSSTHYLAQVRCSVRSRTGPGARYAGYPSDWTEPVHWTTRPKPGDALAVNMPSSEDPGSGAHRVYFYLAASVPVTVILTYFIFLAFHRKMKGWEVSLPSPFQSKALEAVCQAHGERLPSYTEVDDPCMSEVCVLRHINPPNLQEFDCEYKDTTAPPSADSTSSRLLPSQEGCLETGLAWRPDRSTVETTTKDHTLPAGSSEPQGLVGLEVLLCKNRFASNELEPCSDEYQQNPGSSGGTAQDALLDVWQEDVEMHDGYMDCPK